MKSYMLFKEPITEPLKSNWRRSALLTIVKSPHLNKKLPDFDEILYTNADFELDDQIYIFLNSTWQTAAILKIVFGHNSAADCPISMKYCARKQFFTEFRQCDRYPRSTKRIFLFS